MEAALGIRGKIADVLVSHTKLDADHKDIVGRIVTPVAREDALYDILLEQPLDAGGIHRITGKPIQFPAQDTLRFSLLDALHHAVKDRAAGHLGGLLLDKFSDDMEFLLPSQSTENRKLVFDGADLLIFNVGTFAGVEEIVRHRCIIPHNVPYSATGL